MSRYQRKQEFINAYQYLREKDISGAINFCPRIKHSLELGEYFVTTPRGAFLLGQGDYISKDSSGDFHYHSKEDFEEKYEPLAETIHNSEDEKDEYKEISIDEMCEVLSLGTVTNAKFYVKVGRR